MTPHSLVDREEEGAGPPHPPLAPRAIDNPDGHIEAPWLVNGGHSASLRHFPSGWRAGHTDLACGVTLKACSSFAVCTAASGAQALPTITSLDRPLRLGHFAYTCSSASQPCCLSWLSGTPTHATY
jgi:hypothetical protein